MKTTIIICTAILFSIFSYHFSHAQNPKKEKDTIPFVYTVPLDSGYVKSLEGTPYKSMMLFSTATVNIPKSELATQIKETKKTICASIENGEVKISFAFDANAKVFGIGGGMNAGIEVTVSCKNGK